MTLARALARRAARPLLRRTSRGESWAGANGMRAVRRRARQCQSCEWISTQLVVLTSTYIVLLRPMSTRTLQTPIPPLSSNTPLSPHKPQPLRLRLFVLLVPGIPTREHLAPHHRRHVRPQHRRPRPALHPPGLRLLEGVHKNSVHVGRHHAQPQHDLPGRPRLEGRAQQAPPAEHWGMTTGDGCVRDSGGVVRSDNHWHTQFMRCDS